MAEENKISPDPELDVFRDYPDLLDPDWLVEFSFDSCYTRLNPEGPIAELDVAVAMLREYGNPTAVARQLHRSRASVEGFVTRNPKLAKLAKDIGEQFLDDVEAKQKELALMGDPVSARFFLTTLGKNRGYTTREEVTGKDGEKLVVNITGKDAEL